MKHLPEYAAKVGAMREHLRLSQAQFAQRLGCSAMTISRWERGLLSPSAEAFIQLGNIAGKSDCWFYWERAGLRSSDLANILPHVRPMHVHNPQFPQLQVVFAGNGGKIPKAQIVAIPLLKVTTGVPGKTAIRASDLHDTDAEEMMAAPSQLCPNPAYTMCLKVKGNCMSPLIHDGAILAVDSAQTNWSKLDGKIIVVTHEDRGLWVSRLRRYGDISVLESENREHQPIVIQAGSKQWHIIGRVLWWVALAP